MVLWTIDQRRPEWNGEIACDKGRMVCPAFREIRKF